MIVAESFLPRTNGVVNTVMRVAKYLRGAGHEVLILAPGLNASRSYEGVPIVRTASVVLPGIPEADLAFVSTAQIVREIRKFKPDVIHLASPFILGERALKAAASENVPTVAVFQTDVAGFAVHYGLAFAMRAADAWVGRIHRAADITLAPCSDMAKYLLNLGVLEVRRWGRGVDHSTFSPEFRSPGLRASWGCTSDKKVVGFVGRLAPEKKIEKLALLNDRSDIQMVVIGDGPERQRLGRVLPHAIFTGALQGRELGTAMASLDVLVAPGEKETFCQVVQEGMASGVPVVAPNVGGPRDLIDHRVNGVLYTPGSDAHLLGAIESLLVERDLASEVIEAGIHTVRNRTWSSVNSELIDHYSDAIMRKLVKSWAVA